MQPLNFQEGNFHTFIRGVRELITAKWCGEVPRRGMQAAMD